MMYSCYGIVEKLKVSRDVVETISLISHCPLGLGKAVLLTTQGTIHSQMNL